MHWLQCCVSQSQPLPLLTTPPPHPPHLVLRFAACAGNPSTPVHAVPFACGTATIDGGSCTTSCSAGYILTAGSLTSSCRAGAWTGVTGVCSLASQSECSKSMLHGTACTAQLALCGQDAHPATLLHLVAAAACISLHGTAASSRERTGICMPSDRKPRHLHDKLRPKLCANKRHAERSMHQRQLASRHWRLQPLSDMWVSLRLLHACMLRCMPPALINTLANRAPRTVQPAPAAQQHRPTLRRLLVGLRRPTMAFAAHHAHRVTS